MVEEKILYESRPSTRLIWSWIFRCFIIFVLLFLLFGIEVFFTGSGTAYYLLGLFILLFIVIDIYLYFTLRTYKYKITDKGVYFSGGLLTKREKFVPFFKITNVDVVQNFVDQILQIKRLGFQTAGQGASNFPEITFQGLVDTDKPKEIALKWLTK